MAKKPKRRVREEEQRLRRMEYTLRNRALFDRERLMRELRSARLQADQTENYLASLNSAYRSSADYQQRVRTLIKQAFGEKRPDLPPSGMPAGVDAMRYFPTGYTNLRQAVGG